MAEVYLATSFPNDPAATSIPLFALKRLLPRYSSSPTFVERLISEAKLAALLRHPNLVEVLDLGSSGTDFYLQMEWVDGKDLDRILQRLRSMRRQLSTPVISFIVRQIATALTHVHNAHDSAGRPLDLVHCDVTPQNILISYEGDVKLADFGIATAQRSEKTLMTEPPLGKLLYMAPEQIDRKTLDGRTDLYSLGVILFEATTGEKPFEDSSSLLLQEQILNSPPPLDHPLLAKNPEIREVLASLLDKDRTQRPAKAEELMASLPKDDETEARKTLGSLLEKLFAKERSSEKERRERGIEALRQIPAESDDLLAGVLRSPPGNDTSTTGPVETTDAAEKPLPPGETRVQFKPATNEEAGKIAKVELQKKAVPHVFHHRPVEEAEPPTPQPPPAPDDFPKTQDESSTPGVVMEEVSLKEVDLSAPQYQLPTSSLDTTSRKLPEFRIKIPRALLRRLTLIFVVLVLLVPTFLAVSRWISKPSKKADLPIKFVEAFVSMERSEKSADPAVLNSWTSDIGRFKFWVEPVSRLFASEYKRYTGRDEEPFLFSMNSVKREAPAVHWEGSFFNRHLAFDELSTFLGLTKEFPQTDTARVFVHLYPKTFEEQPKYPLDLTEERPRRQGVVYLPLSVKENEESRVRLAHEITHVLGATDKFDDRGSAKFPEGFPEPLLDPLYPQRFGEIMSRGIQESPERYRPFRSLREVRIGAQTAAELGWITNKKADG